MWVSGRQAAELLAGVLPTREHARLILRAGLAGPAVQTSTALLYDEARVRALAGRPPVTWDELGETCPSGLYVARLSRRARVDVNDPWRDTADEVAVQPRMPGLTVALLGVRLRAAGGLPWVATLCGYVVVCAHARGICESESGTVRFHLTPPGVQAASLHGRRLATCPGRPWLLLEPGGAGLSARATP